MMTRAMALSAGLLLATAAQAQDIQQRKQQAFQSADANLAGEVQSFENGVLSVDPYGPVGATSFRVDNQDPVFQGNATITTRGLRKGVPVRVHYDKTPGMFESTAVEVLPANEAQAARQQAEQGQVAGQQPAPGQPAQPGGQLGAEQLKQKQQLFEQADGSQPGTVKEVAQGFLILDPYQTAAGDARLSLPDNTPVYQGNALATRDALKPGADVRVFFDESASGDEQPKVLAVELLPPETANEIRNAVKDVPNRSD